MSELRGVDMYIELALLLVLVAVFFATVHANKTYS
jgi:hypothetical protein